MANPERFVVPDPELPLALLDQKEAGKKLLLITNSDYQYTNKMMQHAFNRFLPNDMSWRDLFDIVIVSARKPEFFQMSQPVYEVVTNDGLMRPFFKAHSGGLYSGGSAQMVEKSLNIQGDEILYVGDHIYTDVSQSKVHLRWRTALKPAHGMLLTMLSIFLLHTKKEENRAFWRCWCVEDSAYYGAD